MPTGETAVDASTTHTARFWPWPRRFAWALLGCWIAVVLAVVLLGDRSSSWATLEADVASGNVHAVRVNGGLSPEGRGFATVELHWRSGLFAYSTSVIERRPAGRGIPRASRDGVTAVFDGDVEDRLTAAQPGLAITHGASPGPSSDVLGWEVSGWLVVAPFTLWYVSMIVLAVSRTTWRATAWAWFWLCLLPPVGPIAYLLLGGPTGIAGKPPEGSTRLTGGWAFLFMILVGGAFSTGR